jgi:large subunit ribosomal protein L35Ae
MEGIINNYRRNRSSQNTKHLIVSVNKIDTKEKATKFIGKKVTFKTETGKEILGEVKSTHGNKGCLRVIFERGIPGQGIGQRVVIE